MEEEAVARTTRTEKTSDGGQTTTTTTTTTHKTKGGFTQTSFDVFVRNMMIMMIMKLRYRYK